MTLKSTWEIGLPVPPQYIGICDTCFYYLSYRLGYYINFLGISPNMITFFGMTCNLLTALSIIQGAKYFLITIFLGTLADTMDGFNARRFNKISKYGALIDHGADWISGIAIIIASVWKWYNYVLFYILISFIFYLEHKNLIYSGYVQQYQGQKDVLFSAMFQKHSNNIKELSSNLLIYKEYNSSAISIILMITFSIMQWVDQYDNSLS